MFLVKSSQIHGGITSKYKNRIKEDFNEEGTDPFSKCINLMNYLNVVGCYTKLIDNIQINIIYVGLVFAFILIIQLCYFVLFVLAWKNKYRSISSVEPEQRNDIAEDVDPANVQDTPVEVFHITPRVLRNNELGISEC
ncbi:hypothetical protein Btru_021131 [Bulinus truncatus]|nr:hypothetical protein Btru_021131 [Bulinus truncatus]